LFRMHRLKGRFVYGYLPALATELEGDHYLRQIGAAFALARAARFTGEERYAARAAQALLALLDDTAPDPSDPQSRRTALPPHGPAPGARNPPRRRRLAGGRHQRAARPRPRPARQVRAAVQLPPPPGPARRLPAPQRRRRRHGGDARGHRPLPRPGAVRA